MENDAPITLSVVMTIVQGGPTLEACLEALGHQVDAPNLQLIIPFDDTVADLAPIRQRFEAASRPGCVYEFIDLGAIETDRAPEHPAGQHELFDRRRAAGLAHARGALIAILEDRGVPRPDWAATAARLHRMPHAVIGGVVDNGVDRLLNWAVYFCDFSRYAPPVDAGPRDYVTDVNVCYKRHAIDRTKDLWQDRYHETTIHWGPAARRRDPVLVVRPRGRPDARAAWLARTDGRALSLGAPVRVHPGERSELARADRVRGRRAPAPRRAAPSACSSPGR